MRHGIPCDILYGVGSEGQSGRHQLPEQGLTGVSEEAVAKSVGVAGALVRAERVHDLSRAHS